MKKVILFAAVISAFSFASCSKDRVCTCQTDQPGSKAQVTTYIKSRKADAREQCMSTKQDMVVQSQVPPYTATTVTVTNTCTLK